MKCQNRVQKVPETLGELMKYDRQRNRLRQADVAEFLGCTQTRVSEYELGKRTPSKRTLNIFIRELRLYSHTGQYNSFFNKRLSTLTYNAKNRIKAFK